MPQTNEVIKLTRGVPPAECFPSSQLAVCTCGVLDHHSDIVLQYGTGGGFPPLRSLLAQEANLSENRVVIGQGTLQLQDTIVRLLINPGDTVYVEEPTYDRTLTILRRAGAKVTGIPLEEDGPDMDFLVNKLESGERPVLFYIIPDFQNPSGKVMSFEKRKQMVELAEKFGFWIIEDSPYRILRYKGEDIPSLFDLNPDRVMYMSSFSKLIAPGLRVGYVIAPDQMAEKLFKFCEDTYINPSYFTHAMVYEFIRRGWLKTNIAELKQLYAPRLKATLAALEKEIGDLGTWSKPEGGFFVGLQLKKSVKAPEILSKAKEKNLILTDGRGFFASGAGDNFIRLPFCALTPEEIKVGVHRLAEVVKEL